MITRADITKLAELALIAVPEAELDMLASEISAILGYVSEVQSLAADQGTPQVPTLRNVLRDDVVTNAPRAYTEEILSQAPDRDGEYLRVKKILSL